MATQTHADDVRQRLLELADTFGVSLARLSALIGRNSSYLQQFIRKGSPRRLEEGDRRLLADFFGVSESELGAIEEKSYNKDEPQRSGDFVAVPRLSGFNAANPAPATENQTLLNKFGYSSAWLQEKALDPDMLSAFTVEGDSMEPILRNGDEVLVDRTPGPWRDGIHVVRVGDTVSVKRLARVGQGQVSLLSQNMAYPPVELGIDDVEVIGRVVWKSGRV